MRKIQQYKSNGQYLYYRHLGYGGFYKELEIQIKPNNQPDLNAYMKDNKMIETNEDDYEFSEFKKR